MYAKDELGYLSAWCIRWHILASIYLMTFTYNFLLSYSAWAVGAGGGKGDAPPPSPRPHQILTDQLILSQPGGREIMPNTLLHSCPQNFHTFLRPCLQFFLSLSLLSRALSWNDDHICNYVWLVTKWHRNLKESSRNFLGSLWRKEDNNNNNYYCM